MKHPLSTLLRLTGAALILAAVGWQLKLHLAAGASVVNFFSYFTNLSNLFAAAVLLLTSVSGRPGQSVRHDQLRFASTVNMAVVGIVFAVLLRDADLGALLAWVNFVLHTLMPCVVVLDWLANPPRRPLGVKNVLATLFFPAVYLLYVLVRGAHAGWYPYPFLNPSQGGYAMVALYAVGITLTFVLAGAVLRTFGNLRQQSQQRSRRRSRRA